MGIFVAGLILMLAGIGVIFTLLFKQEEYSSDFAMGLGLIGIVMIIAGILTVGNS